VVSAGQALFGPANARKPSCRGLRAASDAGSVVLGRDLDEVAARVIEHGGRHWAHVRRKLREPHAPIDEALVLGSDVLDCERGEGDAILDESLLERARRRMLVGFE
jgi:hypothetical protein